MQVEDVEREDTKSWYEISKEVGGVIVVNSLEEEEEARMEEDQEVEHIFKKGQEMKRKILTGTVLYSMSNVSDAVKNKT